MSLTVFGAVAEMQARALELKRRGVRIGFVPTMGALHEGHLSLVRIAREMSQHVVVSLFVNPTQFGPGEDFEAYPRVLERDTELCRAEGVDSLFTPPAGAMYVPDASTFVDESSVSIGLCGGSRPGHFRGVATVVAKLFHIVLPDVAVFGQKDAQQVAVIRRMVRDLNFPLELVIGPIIREPDGVAMSSRNAYLSEAERVQARCLVEGLRAVERLYSGGECSAAVAQAAVEELIREAGAQPEYVACVDHASLQPVSELGPGSLVAIAARVGNTRLIDNTVL